MKTALMAFGIAIIGALTVFNTLMIVDGYRDNKSSKGVCVEMNNALDTPNVVAAVSSAVVIDGTTTCFTGTWTPVTPIKGE